MSIRIFTDSASDITRAELEELQAELIAMPLQCGEETYVDDKTTPVEVFWQMLLDGVNIKTSLPSPDMFVQKFKAAKEAGDEVICILIASKLSGTYQGAMLAKQIVDYDGIHVIDAGHAAASVAEKMLGDRSVPHAGSGVYSGGDRAKAGTAARQRAADCLSGYTGVSGARRTASGGSGEYRDEAAAEADHRLWRGWRDSGCKEMHGQ